VRACLWLLALLSATPAAAQQPLIDPAVRRLLQPEHAEALGGLRVDPQTDPADLPLGGSLSIDSDAQGRLRIGVFLEFDRPQVLDSLRALGVEIGTVLNGMATARVPLAVLERVTTLPLQRIHGARMLRTVTDTSMIVIGANAVRQREADGWNGSTGAGVIVGIIDTGLDIRHRDFRDDTGATRVLALWDQTFGTVPPPGFFYGFLCSRQQIQAVLVTGDVSLCPTQDQAGHGTHVLGIAASSGLASDSAGRFAGVAPEAELLVVKAGTTAFSEDRVVDGLVWLRDEARSRGRSAVVNVSLGHQQGPHDGTTFLERFIDTLVDPGFIIVLAAGNDGANRNVAPAPSTPPQLIHARVQPAAGETAIVEFRITPYSPNTNRCLSVFLELSVWYDIRDRVEITVVRPNSTELTVPSGSTGTSNDRMGRIEISNAAPLHAYGTTGEGYIQINGCDPSGVPAAGTWRIRLRPQPQGPAPGAPIDVYLLGGPLGPGGNAFGTTGFDNRMLVGSPAGARRGIAVGAFVTRVCWPSIAAPENCYNNRPTPGDIMPFSAAGPTRDGRIKPDITAPGMGVFSALSRHVNAPQSRVAPDGQHWLLEGTSMAAPHVTGAIALLLQHRPNLGPEEVLDVLSRSARQDAFTSRVFDASPFARPTDWWGHGKLDVPAALQVLLGGGTLATLRFERATDTIPLGGFGVLRTETRDAAGTTIFAPLTWVSLDPHVARVDEAGRVSGLQLGTARIVVRSGSLADTASVVVTAPATLLIATEAAAPEAPLLSPVGTLLPLLRVRLHAQGPEAVAVHALGFEVSGFDPGARLVLLVEENADAGIGVRSIATADAPLSERPATVMLYPDTLVIPRNSERRLLLALELSGRSPQLGGYTAQLIPDSTRTLTLSSRVANRVEHGALPASGTAATTMLANGELFALSANPVRGNDVNFVFAAPPTVASVYTVTGSRVADLLPLIQGTSFRWNLQNDDGHRVVPGVYIVVFRIAGRVVRQRLFVLSPQAGL
jgi:subtilisin family serine protease